MTILHVSSVGGASGDMILAALIDLGVDAAELQQDLESLSVEPFTIEAETAADHAIHGTRVRVAYEPATDPKARHLSDIRAMIEASALPPVVKDESVGIFTRIAEAEAEIHGTTVDKIHFHEIGALDSIVDIVGCCLAKERLGVTAVCVDPLPLGRGTMTCAHGVMPIPAPATVRLLMGFPTVQTDEPFELVTPTGAAVLHSWNSVPRLPHASRTTSIGYGIGHRTLNSRPNLLRATLVEPCAAHSAGPAAAEERDDCLVLECNLDDTIPELLGSLTERLLAEGALDVFTRGVQMKKQRPGTLLSVVCNPAARDVLIDLIFRESTTFGVREYSVQRTILARRHEEVATAYGTVRIKIGNWCGEDITYAPEHADCVACAKKARVAVRVVYEAALAAFRQG